MERGESLGRQLKRARMARGMTQAEAARSIQAQQSAISMFERGDSSALGLDRVQRLAELLGVSLAPGALAGVAPAKALGFCEEVDCPSHARRIVGVRLIVQAGFVRMPGDGPALCAICLSPLHRSCPACEAPLVESLQCGSCSKPYFQPLEFDDPAMARRHLLRSLASSNPELARSHPEYLLFEDEPMGAESPEILVDLEPKAGQATVLRPPISMPPGRRGGDA